MHNKITHQGLQELVASLTAASADLNFFLGQRQTSKLSCVDPAPDVPLTPENAPFHDAKGAIIEAAERIIELVRGPRDLLLDISFQHCATASLQVIQRLRLPHHVPLKGATTYAQIAEAVGDGASQTLVERVLQHAMSYGLFSEPSPGRVSHNAASALLVTDPDLEAWVYLCTNVAYPAGAVIPKAIEQYGVSSEADESAYGVSIGRKISQFGRFCEPDGHKLHELFAKAMRGIAKGGAYDVSHAVTGYPWHELENGHSTLVVDVGGGPGHFSIALANRHPSLKFEVQDLPVTVEVGARDCPVYLKDRVTFRAHDFFQAQPSCVIGSELPIAYFARFILHDWSDKYAKQILEAMAKSLRPQDRIILNEVVVPAPGVMPREIERRLHDRDMLMLMNLNGRERTENAFNELFRTTNPSLQLVKVYRPTQGELSLIEVMLADPPGLGSNGTHASNGVQSNGDS